MDHSNDIDEQEVMESFRKMKRHVGIVYFMNTLRHDSYRDIDDPNYRDPTNAEVVEVIDTMAFLGFKKTDVAKLLGIRTVSKDKTKTLRKWCEGESDAVSTIPYSLFLVGSPFGTKWQKMFGECRARRRLGSKFTVM